MSRHIVMPGFVDDVLEALRQLGVDPEPLLAQSNLPAKVTAPITAEQFGALWLQTRAALDDEFFGLGARPMRSGSLAMLCHATLHAPTLEKALKRALDFLGLVLDAPRGRLVVSDGLAQILLSPASGAQPAFAYRTYWLILHGISCWLIGRRIPIRQVDFACPAPENRADYTHFFGAPVRFDQTQTRLVYAADYLSLAPIRSQAALQDFLKHAPANLLTRYRHDGGLVLRLRDILSTTPCRDWPNFTALAARLDMAPATMRRQLRLEGQSFQEIKDELRNAQAQALLRDSPRSIADIAAHCGYSEPSAFFRAFVKWTGQSPSGFRERCHGQSRGI